MHRHDPRRYRRVSLDTAHLDEPDFAERSLDRLMRGTPTPLQERVKSVRTRNGNIVVAVAR